MFNQKNALISLAVALLISACGGGGGGSPDPAGATPPPAAGDTPPPGDDPTPPPTIDESVMEGNLQLVDPAVLFNGVGINVSQFEPNAVLADGAGPFAKGTDAPVSTFGLRVSPDEMAPDGAGQSKRVRIAFDLAEEAGTVGAGEQAEVLQFMIDQVDLVVSDTGQLAVSVPTSARMFVYAKNSADATANFTVTELPADAVRLVDITDDPTSKALTVDFDALFARLLAAAQGDTARLAVFNSVKDFVGTFGMNATISNVAMLKGDGTTAATGASITVTGSDQPAVTGAGLTGRLKVE